LNIRPIHAPRLKDLGEAQACMVQGARGYAERMRMIFVNLPVKDLSASKEFFTAIGFSFNDQYSDDSAACMVVDENIFVMLLVEERFKDFINGEIADATTTTETLVALSADSREEIDETVEKALAAGGKEWKPAMDEGPMYGHSFQDPDGHVWELMHMAPQ
jgi:predicted lactoylglutathione lyase